MKQKLFFLLIIIFAIGASVITIRLNNYYLQKTFQQSSSNTFYLLSVLVAHYLNESERIEKMDSISLNINDILDNLVKSSTLIYFAVLDEEKNPIVFSTIYDEYLPIRTSGTHIIKTPGGNILQIEDEISERYFISGFALEPVEKIIRTNNILILIILGIFIGVSSILFFNIFQFEKYKIAKEEEIINLKEINALTTGFSHEFRNSLHTLSLLAHEITGDEAKILKGEIERMNSIMDSLKLLNRTEVKKERIELRSLMNEALSICKNILPEGVNINQNIDQGFVIAGDPVLLTVVFVNLIKNSIEAKAKNINIKGVKKGRDILIEITDDGTGIEEKEISRIFEPFYSKKGQTGLGLYLVKKIITAHSGNIEVSSKDGTRFVIILKEGKV